MHGQTTLKQYLVKYKSIITSALLKLKSTVSEKLPLGGIVPGKLQYYKFPVSNILRLSSFKLSIHPQNK